ncbi:FecCD family ABC transporter permease [Shewanella maritima]|uniref:FecCD family ABC transporter permease n=1 Tax=Shewanella maritima TaxID=2520507 RepID=UPI00373596A0
MSSRNFVISCIVLTVITLISPWLSAGMGAANIGFADVFRALQNLFVASDVQANAEQQIAERIVFELRMPRIILAFIAGAGLAIAGNVLQLVTRNPLADPYLFGISSGAAFGAVIVFTVFGSLFDINALTQLGANQWHLGQFVLPIGAFIGAAASVLLVLSLSGLGVNHQVERMLLSGVAVSFMFGAMTSLVLYFSSPQASASVLFWTLGSFAKASWAGLVIPATVVLIALGIIVANKRHIIALQAGDETAHTLGVNVAKMRLNMLLLCSLITAVLVASCGGIGFVGLMIPHVVRLCLPGRQPLVLTAIVGGLFMLWIDVLARCMLANQELPVGIITSAIGSVFFLFILRGRH